MGQEPENTSKNAFTQFATRVGMVLVETFIVQAAIAEERARINRQAIPAVGHQIIVRGGQHVWSWNA